MTTSIILLAAGGSSRMGESKQLLSVGDEVLLTKSVKAALGAEAGNVVVVLGSNAKNHRDVLANCPVDIVENMEWTRGIGSSIKVGLRHACDHSVDAVLIMVCDQPYLTSAHLKKLIENISAEKMSIAASYYDGSLGVPAAFSKHYFAALLSVPDDQGAKKILREYARHAVTIPFDKGEVDLDTREDYERYRRSIK